MRVLEIIVLGLLAVAASHADDRQAVEQAIRKILPNTQAPQIKSSPIPGVSEVAIGTQVFYVTDDGRYLLGGPLVAASDGRNLTEARLATIRQQLLADASQLRTYRYPADSIKYRITVFTDIDCPHCRRMHKRIPEYQQAGIDVTYVMLPRTGKDSPSYFKTVSAVCASDPEAAITAAMGGDNPKTSQCEHPIDDHLALARSLNLGSTPSIVLPDGRLVLGYQEPEELLALLQTSQVSSK